MCVVSFAYEFIWYGVQSTVHEFIGDSDVVLVRAPVERVARLKEFDNDERVLQPQCTLQ